MEDTYPQKVLASIDAGATPAETKLVKAANTVRDNLASFPGREGMHYENILAQAVWHAHSQDSSNPRLSALAEDAWNRVQSPIGLRNRFLTGHEDLDGYIRLINEIAAERFMADTMGLDGASEALRELVTELAAAHPSLGLTFGYIGNCSLGCGPAYDDRSWKVFTRLASTSYGQSSNISWGGYTTEHLGRMAQAAMKALPDWCAERVEDIVAGRAYPIRNAA